MIPPERWVLINVFSFLAAYLAGKDKDDPKSEFLLIFCLWLF